jgi:hypothetical protein
LHFTNVAAPPAISSRHLRKPAKAGVSTQLKCARPRREYASRTATVSTSGLACLIQAHASIVDCVAASVGRVSYGSSSGLGSRIIVVCAATEEPLRQTLFALNQADPRHPVATAHIALRVRGYSGNKS